jgi:hypothetical protein
MWRLKHAEDSLFIAVRLGNVMLGNDESVEESSLLLREVQALRVNARTPVAGVAGVRSHQFG